jgi:type IV fimbrial biogenesis protein FimT
MKPPIGFTLIELMLTLTVAAVLMIIAVPSFREFLQNSRMSAQVNLFISDLNIARSEAVKRRARVTMCKSSTLTSCTTSGGWEQGWIVFIDADGDGTVDDGDGDSVLRTQEPVGGDLTIRGNSNVQNRVAFFDSGDVRVYGTLIFCDARIQTFNSDKFKARAIIISQPGRIRAVKGNDSSLSVTNCTATSSG